MKGGFKVRLTARFERDFKGLPVDIKKLASECIKDFCRDPLPESRRPHRVNSTAPKVFSMDVAGNKSYKITFQIEGNEAILLRVATHKDIDRRNA